MLPPRFCWVLACVVGLLGCAPEPGEAIDAVTAHAAPLTFWTEKLQELTPIPGRPYAVDYETYGTSIAVSGETAIVVDRYGVSTFDRVDSAWAPQSEGQVVGWCDELNGPAAARGRAALFGNVVLFAGNGVAGRFGPCVYERVGRDWNYTQTLAVEAGSETLSGGFAISGNTAMMGSSLGIAVFERTSTGFTHTQSVNTSDDAPGAKSFALSEDTLFALSGGSVYLFTNGGTGWAETQVLTPADGRPYVAIVVSGDRLLLRSDSGVYAFNYASASGEWRLDSLVAPFARVMAVQGDFVLLDDAFYERVEDEWRLVEKLAVNPPRTDIVSGPPMRDVVALAFTTTGALVGMSSQVGQDGLIHQGAGKVYAFNRITEPDHCQVDAECQSGHCEEGVCCRTACSGTCESCLAARKGGGVDGICGLVIEDTDPRDSCASDPVASCGHTGLCNRFGKCAYYQDGTACGSGYTCVLGACMTECFVESDCDTEHDYHCVDGACRLPGDNGEPGAGGAGGAPDSSAGAGGTNGGGVTGGQSSSGNGGNTNAAGAAGVGGEPAGAGAGATSDEPSTGGVAGRAPTSSTGGHSAGAASEPDEPSGRGASCGCRMSPPSASAPWSLALALAVVRSLRKRRRYASAA